MKKNFVDRFLNLTEKVGNKLPAPAIIFACFAFMVLILSWLLSLFNVSVLHPGTGETISVVNLLSIKGLHDILTNTITNFTSFAPLGVVLVAVLGVSVAEESGLISAILRLVIHSTPKKYITFILIFSGTLTHVASDVGYVILIPLGAIIFLAIGRHPLAGIAAAFAGVSGGYSANLLIGPVDPLLAGLSQEAARIINPNYAVSPLCNYYFMFFSAFLIAILGTIVTEKLIIPRLGEYTEASDHKIDFSKVNSLEKKALLYTLLVFLIFLGVIVLGLVPENGFLRATKNGSIIFSPFIKGIITVIFILGSILGVFFGFISKKFKTSKDVVASMVKGMSHLGTYIVLVFFAAQFIAYFKWSNIGIVIAVDGAILIKAVGLGAIPNIFLFVLLCAFLNLFMGSAAAKWALLAPIFIPMFMILGYTPELTQVAYRIGDSVTNVVSPMMSYFALIIMYFEKYDKKAGIGTVISTMLPYSVVFLISWSIFLTIWLSLNIPIGPGSTLFLK